MLRNCLCEYGCALFFEVLNEVLSLNAQECRPERRPVRRVRGPQ